MWQVQVQVQVRREKMAARRGKRDRSVGAFPKRRPGAVGPVSTARSAPSARARAG